MSASFFHRNKSGAILTRLISDIALAQNLVGTAITNIWMDAIALVVILYFLLRIDVLTTIMALATFPVYLFFFRRFSREMRTVTRQLQDELSTWQQRPGADRRQRRSPRVCPGTHRKEAV
jgi:ABC-type multidrug transport system fused ATPase/permease subunit